MEHNPVQCVETYPITDGADSQAWAPRDCDSSSTAAMWKAGGAGDAANHPSQEERLSIAICTVGELFGGVERHVLGLLQGLAESGAQTLLILFHDGELAAQAREQGARVLIAQNRNSSVLAAARQLAAIFERHNIGLVHVHGYKAAVFCALARRWYPVGIVKTEHGLPEPIGPRVLRGLRVRAYHLAGVAATRISRAAVCYVTGDLMKRYRHLHAGLRAMVIPNGVSPMEQSAHPRPHDLPHGSFNLIAVGRLDKVKGLSVAIEAIADERAPVDAQLHIIGTGPCEAELRGLTEGHGLGLRVHFLGFRRNVYDYIAYCDALLMPSLHEGLPYTLLEAMSLGKATIASRVGGLAEVLRDGISGCLVPPRDAASLAHAMAKMRGDDSFRQRLGANAQRVQRSEYSLRAMTDRYLGVYRDVINNRAGIDSECR